PTGSAVETPLSYRRRPVSSPTAAWAPAFAGVTIPFNPDRLEARTRLVHPLPDLPQALAVRQRAGLGEAVSVELDREGLILADEAGGNGIACEIHMLGIGVSLEGTGAAGRVERASLFRVVSSEYEVAIRNDLDVAGAFGKL